MVNGIMLSVIMLNVIMLSVVAPLEMPPKDKHTSLLRSLINYSRKKF
jgi:hypothetical protein